MGTPPVAGSTHARSDRVTTPINLAQWRPWRIDQQLLVRSKTQRI